RVKARGWHVQVYTRLSVIEAVGDDIRASDVPIVVDHFGAADAALGVAQPGFQTLVGLVQSGKAYVKISGAYRCSANGPDYADGWTVVHGDGTMNTKAEYLADLKSGARKFDGGVVVRDFSVRVYGDTAIAAGTSESKVTIDGKPQGGSLRFTRIYVRRDGRWIMIATHATRR